MGGEGPFGGYGRRPHQQAGKTHNRAIGPNPPTHFLNRLRSDQPQPMAERLPTTGGNGEAVREPIVALRLVQQVLLRLLLPRRALKCPPDNLWPMALGIQYFQESKVGR